MNTEYQSGDLVQVKMPPKKAINDDWDAFEWRTGKVVQPTVNLSRDVVYEIHGVSGDKFITIAPARSMRRI